MKEIEREGGRGEGGGERERGKVGEEEQKDQSVICYLVIQPLTALHIQLDHKNTRRSVMMSTMVGHA